MLTKNAVGNLINKYKSVLAKCRVLNILGTLSVTTVLAMGASTGIAHADTVADVSDAISGHVILDEGYLTLSGIALLPVGEDGEDGEEGEDGDDILDTTIIENDATLTLTGSMDGQAVPVLNGGTIENYGVLTVGLSDGTSLTAIGDFVLMEGSNTTFYNSIAIIGNLSISGDETSFSGAINSVSGLTSISGGYVGIDAGSTLNVVDLDLTGGSGATVTVDGILNVSGTITWDEADDDYTNNITVNNGGNLITNTSNIYTYSDGTVTFVSGLTSADLSFDGVSMLSFSGVDEITKDEYDKVKTALYASETDLGDDFLFDFGDAVITGLDANDIASTDGNKVNIDYNLPSETATVDGSGLTLESDNSLMISASNSGSLAGMVFTNVDNDATRFIYEVGSNTITFAGNVDGGGLISALTNDGTMLLADVTVGQNGTLNLGTANTEENKSGTLESVELAENSTMNVTGSTIDESATSSFTVENGITLGENATVNVANNAALTLSGSTTLGEGSSISVVGNSSTIIESIAVNNGNSGSIPYIFADPSYVAVKSLVDSSGATGTLDCNIYVSEGSTFSLGTQDFIAYAADNTVELARLFSNMGITLQSLATGGFVPSESTQTLLYLGLGETLTLGKGSIIVDDAVNTSGEVNGVAQTGLYLGADSFLVVNVAGFDADTAVINGTDSDGNKANLYVDTGSTLGLVGATAGTYTILEDFGTASGTLWTDENVFVGNILQEIDSVSGDGTTTPYTVTIGIVEDSPLYNGSLGHIIYNAAHLNDGAGFSASSDLAGVRLIYNMASSGKSTKKILATLQSASTLASSAATNASTYQASRTAVQIQQGRYNLSGISGLGASTSSEMNVVTHHADGSVKEEFSGVYQVAANGSLENLQTSKDKNNSLALWFMPLFAHENVSGMQSGDYSSDYTTDMYGAAMGLDKTYTPSFADAVRVGLAFNVGMGETSTSGDFDGVESDFDFFGIAAYGSAQFGKLTLSADLGYTKNASEISQDLSAYGAENLKADVDSHIWHMGLRAEYTHIFDNDIRCIPHLGLDFMTMKTDDYDVHSVAGGTAFKVESDRQNMFSMPVGLTLAKPFDLESGWNMVPKISLGAIFAMGDLDEETSTRMVGIDGMSRISTDVVDPATLDFGLGFTATQDNVRLALDYNIQISDNRTAHGVMGIVEYKF